MFGSLPFEEAISFCTAVIDSSGVAGKLESRLVKNTGRPRQMKVRAILVALLLLAIDDRPLHIKAATKLLFCLLPGAWQAELGITAEATGRKAFLARYRQARYLFGLVLAVVDPSAEPKDRVLPAKELAARRKKLGEAELAARQVALEGLVADLLEASVKVCSADELAGFDGSVGLDATPVPLWSRGPSVRRGTCASDPDGGLVRARGRPPGGHRARRQGPPKGLLGVRSLDRDDGPARRDCPFLPQPGPRPVPRPARPRPRWHRGPALGPGALPGLARWLFGAPTGAIPSAGPSTSTCRCGRSVIRW